MSRALLTAHRRIATTDVDQARLELSEHFCPHVLQPTGAADSSTWSTTQR